MQRGRGPGMDDVNYMTSDSSMVKSPEKRKVMVDKLNNQHQLQKLRRAQIRYRQELTRVMKGEDPNKVRQSIPLPSTSKTLHYERPNHSIYVLNPPQPYYREDFRVPDG